MKKITSARQIGQVIRKKRTALGLTQQQLADVAHVSRGFINRIEKGASTAVYPDKLLDVLKALDLSLLIENHDNLSRSTKVEYQSSTNLPNEKEAYSIKLSYKPKDLQIDSSLLSKFYSDIAKKVVEERCPKDKE